MIIKLYFLYICAKICLVKHLYERGRVTMSTAKLIGRKAECARLERCLSANEAQLIVVYGRRRVGKTYLINQFFDNHFDFKITGAFEQPRISQLRHFSAELERQTGVTQDVPDDWTKAFQLLRNYLEQLPQNQKHIVFIDELPWLDTHRSGFLPAFEWFWNDWGCTQDNLVLIVCGSATAWMTDKIANNKGGLFSRQTCKIFLEPFTLAETEVYLQSRGIDWARYDITECYMIMGGIPYYLALLSPELSCSQNIDELFFRKRAELGDEFFHLYRTLFSNSERYIQIVEALNKRKGGLSLKEIARETGLPANGDLSGMVSNLLNSGFIRKTVPFGHKNRDSIYQLSDYYTMFYLRFLHGRTGQDEHFWTNMLDHPSRRSWAGLTFEQVCRDHIAQIKYRLGISGILTSESSWACAPVTDDEKSKGAQIDLLIERRDRVINICEIKHSINEYEIDKEYERTLRDKIDAFRRETGTKNTLQLTMITTYGVRKNKYSGLISNQITLEDLFTEKV